MCRLDTVELGSGELKRRNVKNATQWNLNKCIAPDRHWLYIFSRCIKSINLNCYSINKSWKIQNTEVRISDLLRDRFNIQKKLIGLDHYFNRVKPKIVIVLTHAKLPERSCPAAPGYWWEWQLSSLAWWGHTVLIDSTSVIMFLMFPWVQNQKRRV